LAVRFLAGRDHLAGAGSRSVTSAWTGGNGGLESLFCAWARDRCPRWTSSGHWRPIATRTRWAGRSP